MVHFCREMGRKSERGESKSMVEIACFLNYFSLSVLFFFWSMGSCGERGILYKSSAETKSEREYGYCGSVLMNYQFTKFQLLEDPTIVRSKG